MALASAFLCLPHTSIADMPRPARLVSLSFCASSIVSESTLCSLLIQITTPCSHGRILSFNSRYECWTFLFFGEKQIFAKYSSVPRGWWSGRGRRPARDQRGWDMTQTCAASPPHQKTRQYFPENDSFHFRNTFCTDLFGYICLFFSSNRLWLRQQRFVQFESLQSCQHQTCRLQTKILSGRYYLQSICNIYSWNLIFF